MSAGCGGLRRRSDIGRAAGEDRHTRHFARRRGGNAAPAVPVLTGSAPDIAPPVRSATAGTAFPFASILVVGLLDAELADAEPQRARLQIQQLRRAARSL